MKKVPTEIGGEGRGGQRGAFLCGRCRPPQTTLMLAASQLRLGDLASFGCASESPASHMLIWAKSASQFVVAGSMDLLKQCEGICGLRKASCSPSPETSVRWGEAVQIERQRL